MNLLAKIDRRTLLIGGGVGIGLVAGYLAWPRGLATKLPVRKGEWAFGAYLKIARDGRVTVAVPQVETGQGIWTALPQVVADELGAAWANVAVEPAPLVDGYANPLAAGEGWLDGVGQWRRYSLTGNPDQPITAGSTSVRAFEQPMREAAAIVRAMLVGAAADRWNVDPSACEVMDGLVIHSGNSFDFGELAEEAAERTPPDNAEMRTGTRARLAGQSLPRLDGPAKANGSFRLAADVRLPDMLFASARIAPRNGRLLAFDRGAAERVTGVRAVVADDRSVAAVADNWWAAEKALKGARVRFEAPEQNAGDLRTQFEDRLRQGELEDRYRAGDYQAAVEGSRPLSATYWVAPSLHLGLETLNATARLQGGTLEIWAPSQAPEAARRRAEHAAGSRAERVLYYPMPVGDSGGRALEADAIPMVTRLALQMQRPVQLILSQSASQNHDHPSGGALARMHALPGSAGTPAAWYMQLVSGGGTSASFNAVFDGKAGTELAASDLAGSVPPYSIPNVSIDGAMADLPFDAGYMRASPQREFCFFTESFVDELARASGLEPLAFRMAMLGNNGRLARCLQAAARDAKWDGGRGGSTMGLAGCSAFGSHIGLVAFASIGEDQRIAVHRLVAAVDCGRVINPALVRQQIEGGLLWALGQARVSSPEWVAAMPRARPIGGIALPKLDAIPEIVVRIIANDDPPGGVSGLGATVLAPAVANAIFSGSGKRLRSLPFDVAAVA